MVLSLLQVICLDVVSELACRARFPHIRGSLAPDKTDYDQDLERSCGRKVQARRYGSGAASNTNRQELERGHKQGKFWSPFTMLNLSAVTARRTVYVQVAVFDRLPIAVRNGLGLFDVVGLP